VARVSPEKGGRGAGTGLVWRGERFRLLLREGGEIKKYRFFPGFTGEYRCSKESENFLSEYTSRQSGLKE
jgi:hypothetical protein